MTALFVLVSLGVARFSWQIPVLVRAERALFDVRAVFTAPRVDQDPRIAMFSYTETTLEKTARRSPVDRTLLAHALTNLDKLGAKAIGVDILIDQSVPGEDDTLVAALRAMHTPLYFAFATSKDTSEFMQPWQEKHLRGFLAATAPMVRPGGIRIEADKDDVLRNWPALATQVPLMPRLLAGEADEYAGMIRFREPKMNDGAVFFESAIELLDNPAAAQALAPRIKDRIVIVGADLPKDDRFDTALTAATGRTMAGTEILAHMTAQALDRDWPQPLSSWAIWVLCLLAVTGGSLTTLYDQRAGALGLTILAQAAVILGLPFLFAARGADTTGFPALGLALGWLGAFIAVGAAARSVGTQERKFAEGALGQYLPKDVAELILREPERLALSGEHREIYALFSDMEGFTKLCHKLTPEEVATFLNDYLDHLCAIVLKNGGTIDKFVGDAVVAFWGAPVARPDDADRALAAATEMALPCQLKVAGDARTGKTRIGLHFGQTVVGNFGGSGRLQYTALGDTMNTAARLEGANKGLKTCALVSGDAAARMDARGLRPMGRVTLRGRAVPIDVFEPTLDYAFAAKLKIVYADFEAGEEGSLAALWAMAETRPDDTALAALVARVAIHGPGGSLVME